MESVFFFILYHVVDSFMLKVIEMKEFILTQKVVFGYNIGYPCVLRYFVFLENYTFDHCILFLFSHRTLCILCLLLIDKLKNR